jgi:general secretion pathway protein G
MFSYIKIQKTHKGFTMIEILTTIAIIGVLATVVLVAVSSAREKANISKAKAGLNDLYNAIQELSIDTGEWPDHKDVDTTEGGVSGNEIFDLSCGTCGLLTDDASQSYVGWSGPYLSELPVDPWGNNYYFDTDWDIEEGAGVTWAVAVGSAGPDGEGPEYNDDDIIKILYTDN